MGHQPLLTEIERAALEALVRVHGVAGAARIAGLSRTGIQSLLLGRAREGTVLQFRARAESRTFT